MVRIFSSIPLKPLMAGLMALLMVLGIVLYSKNATNALPVTVGTTSLSAFPPVILWAWERPERLSFINPKEIGVAFLAKTLFLKGDTVRVRPRIQPLSVPPQTPLIAVVRIESPGIEGIDNRATPQLINRITEQILTLSRGQNIGAIQVDFDARTSERGFYRQLLTTLRARLPESMPLQMTALASWCTHEDWLNDLPVTETIPMVFRMGQDTRKIHQFLARERDFNSPRCRHAVGVSTDEAIPTHLARLMSDPRRTVYLFNPKPWTPQALETMLKEITP